MVIKNGDVYGSFVDCILFGCCGKGGEKRCKKRALKKIQKKFFKLYDKCPTMDTSKHNNQSPTLWVYGNDCGDIAGNLKYLNTTSSNFNGLDWAAFYFNISKIDGNTYEMYDTTKEMMREAAQELKDKYDVWGLRYDYEPYIAQAQDESSGDMYDYTAYKPANFRRYPINTLGEDIEFDNTVDAQAVNELLKRGSSIHHTQNGYYDMGEAISPYYYSTLCTQTWWQDRISLSSFCYYIGIQRRTMAVPSRGNHQIDMLNNFFTSWESYDNDSGYSTYWHYPKEFIKYYLGVDHVKCQSTTHYWSSYCSIKGILSEQQVRDMTPEQFSLLIAVAGDYAVQRPKKSYWKQALSIASFFAGALTMNPYLMMATTIAKSAYESHLANKAQDAAHEQWVESNSAANNVKQKNVSTVEDDMAELDEIRYELTQLNRDMNECNVGLELKEIYKNLMT